MALPVESAESKRKPNFTDSEKLFLVQQYERHKRTLSSRLCDGVTNRHKQEIWQQITDELNRRNHHVDRTTKDVKKKWENLATQARKEMIDYRQNAAAGASASMIVPPSAITMKVLELLDDAPIPSKTNGFAKLELDGEDSNEDHYPLTDSAYLDSTNGGLSDHGNNCADTAADHRNGQPTIESIEGGVGQPSAADSAHQSIDNEPSLQAVMGLWRQQQQLLFSDSIADCGTSGSANDAPSPTASRPAASSHGRDRRRRRDEFDDSDSNLSPGHLRNDVKRLKRLKLQLETEKLMLEKKKLELEILVLNKQLSRDA